MIILKTEKEIDCIRESCGIVAYTLSKLKDEIRPGVTTAYLDEMAEELCREKGGIPGFKGYRDFPFSICASKNNEVVHGFPDDVPLKSNDILSIDFGVLYKGWYGDSAFTVPVYNVSPLAKRLIKVGNECLQLAIRNTGPYCKLGDISSSVQQHAENNGFNVVREFVGHGIGRNLHEEPSIPNFGEQGTGYILKPGTVIAIEPMITAGDYRVQTLDDNWTTTTLDGSLAVHFEHTVAITTDGVEVLTKRD